MPGLFVHPGAAARIERARAWMGQWPSSQPLTVVTANPDSGNELVRVTVTEAGSGACFGWRRITLGRLAAELAQTELATSGLVPITRLATEAVLTRVVHDLRQENRLGRYATVAGAPGFARAVGGVIEELRLAMVESPALDDLAPELATILDRYEEALGDAGLADRAIVYRLATEGVSGKENQDWLGFPTLLLDLPIATAAEQELVAEVTRRSENVLATCPEGDLPTVERLRALGFAVEADRNGFAGVAPAIARVQRHLFAETAPEEAGGAEGLVVVSAPGESRECVEIARQVLALARTGVRFDRMAVLMRSPEEYRSHIEEAFERAGIPMHLAKGTRVPDPAGRALLALLDCARDGLSAKRFAEYLSLGEVPDVSGDGAPPEKLAAAERWVAPDDELLPEAVADSLAEAQSAGEAAEDPDSNAYQGTLRAPRQWEQFLIDAAVIGGRDRWERRLDGHAAEIRLRREQLDDPDGPEAERYDLQLKRLEALRTFALPLLDEMASWPEQADWGDWFERVGDLASRTVRHLENVLRVLAELSPLAGVGPVTLDEVREVLSRRLLEIATPPEKSRYGRVFVAPAEAARGLWFDVVFVPGMAEKLFPKDVREEPILLDEVRRKLDAGLETNTDRVSRERFVLRLAVGAATRRLVLSYPRIDLEKARPRVPSFYGLEAIRAAEGRLPDFEQFATRAESAATSRIGWPAPADAGEAIDEAEHDLALLQSLRGKTEEESAGTARYLLTANPHLGRALRFRARRWLRRWTPPDGLIEPGEAAADALRDHGLDGRSFSPTALQLLAKCPYSFFLHAIQNLTPREMPEAIDQLDPLQRGALIHEIQFELLRGLQTDGLLPVTSAKLYWASIKLDKIVAEVAERYREDLAPAIDRVWQAGVEGIRGDLQEWLRQMAEDGSGFVPWRFEHGFGLRARAGHGAESVATPAVLDGGLRLRGSIDLIECRRDGHLRVTDHKTGKAAVPEGAVIQGGTSLQPVFYALAAEKLFPEHAVAGGRLWYCTAAGGYEQREVVLDGGARERALHVIGVLRQALEDGFFPAYPAAGACDTCDYAVICGPYEGLRTSRKPVGHEPLQPLLKLRELS